MVSEGWLKQGRQRLLVGFVRDWGRKAVVETIDEKAHAPSIEGKYLHRLLHDKMKARTKFPMNSRIVLVLPCNLRLELTAK